MPQVCKVCSHPKRDQIDAALIDRSQSARAVARAFGLSSSSLQRHYDAHVAGAVAASLEEDCPTAASLDEIDRIIAEAEEQPGQPGQPGQVSQNEHANEPGQPGQVALSTTCGKDRAPRSFKQRAARLMEIALGKKEDRLHLLDDDLQRLELIRQERAADMADVPGGRSGFLVRKFKKIGDEVIEEYQFDRALAAERRAHAEQAARELGDRPDHGRGGAGGQVVILAPQIGPDHPLAHIKPVEIQTVAGRVLPEPEPVEIQTIAAPEPEPVEIQTIAAPEPGSKPPK